MHSCRDMKDFKFSIRFFENFQKRQRHLGLTLERCDDLSHSRFTMTEKYKPNTTNQSETPGNSKPRNSEKY